MSTVEQLYAEWQDLRPVSEEVQRRLDRKFMLEFNYNSNHLEGNTLTYGQTELLLRFGLTSGDGKLRDYEEMRAHNVGLEFVKREAADKKRPLTEMFIRELNRTILVEDFYKAGKTEAGSTPYEVKVGVYKTRPNSVRTVTGEIFDYASPEETPALMADLVRWYNDVQMRGEFSPVELAALFHYRYIRIHPFEDGNGRIARLLVNYILHRNGYPMVVVKSSDKDNYLTALHKCDVAVGPVPSDGAAAPPELIGPFTQYIEGLTRQALELCIRAARGESIEDDDDFAKRIKLLKREAKSKKSDIGFSEEQVWNVLERFYFPLEQRIINALKPSADLFSAIYQFNTLSKNESKINGVHVNSTLHGRTSSLIKDFVSNAKRMFFYYNMESPKRDYGLGDLSIALNFHITFEDTYYTVTALPGKKYDYGTYPTREETDGIVDRYKAEVLEKIEKAVTAG